MSDDLIERLRHGCVYRPRRWSGDTHTDIGGTINEDATDAVMAEAADEIERLRRKEQWVRNCISALRSEAEFWQDDPSGVVGQVLGRIEKVLNEDGA